jgi:hypothetical protein
MTKQKIKSFDNVSRLKKIIVVTGIFVSLFGGMFMAIIAIDNFKNYDNPYLFGFTFGTLGLLSGLLLARKIKPYVILNPKMLTNYSSLSIMFTIGFIGISMLGGQYFNTTTSTLYKCDTFIVLDKEFYKGGFRRPEKNILILNVEGVSKRLLCRQNFWQTISVGQTTNACIYKSPIGFDYLTLTVDK